MAISRLATSNPASNTDILLYTGNRTILSSVIATNKSSDAATIRVWVVPLDQDATAANHVFISYNVSIIKINSVNTGNKFKNLIKYAKPFIMRTKCSKTNEMAL